MDTFIAALAASLSLGAAADTIGPVPAARTGEEVVKVQCSLCHGPGVGGAPRIGDRKAWEKRLSGGEDRLVASALQGRGAMPPNGGLADLSRQELRAAIDYMVRSSGAR